MLTREKAKSKLISYWQNEDLIFLAVFKAVKPTASGKKPHGYFHLKSNDRRLIFPPLEGYNFPRSVTIFSYQTPDLIDGRVYQLVVDIADDQFRQKSNHPFLLKIAEIYKIEQSLNVIPAKDFIANWFGRKGENPGDAASIAGQLRLNQLELYTQTKRFIFELIQNADDMPVPGKSVQIEIRLLENYFVFRHDGQYFSREDVMAISDAAKSTKRSDETKTGYKGIGFKSVFSDSETVYILSHDYSFRFDKSADIYRNFKTLYQPYWSRFSFAEQNKFFNENKGKEREHTNIDNIPWQIKPIWTELMDIPDEIRPYFSRTKNVNIALKVGASKILEKRYNDMIEGLVDDPRFLLFLRNARRIDYWPPTGPRKTIEVIKAGGITEVYANEQLTSAYRTFDAEIAINNEAFSRAGFNFEHIQLEEEKFAFKDANGNILNNIPEKLGSLKTTILSFAVKIVDNKIERIPASESILYNYLPTSDQRYYFPFIINADFISKTDREGILSENIWNHYLFFNIGYELTNWLCSLSKHRKYLSSYLNILPDDLLDEKHEDLSTINTAFNKGLLSGISKNAFIPNTAGANAFASMLMIDDTGLSDLIGEQAFMDFIESAKSLVNPTTDKIKLKTKYLDIEVFDFKQLRENLKDPVKRIKLNESLKSLNSNNRDNFMGWLDKACEKDLTFADISSLTFVKLEKKIPTFIDILQFQSDKNCLFRSELTEKLLPQLTKTSTSISDFSIDSFPHLLSVLIKNNTYLSSDNLVYVRITALFSDRLPKLAASDRLRILEVLRTLKGIDIGTVAKLPWYRNNLGEFKPLTDLFDNGDFIYSSSYNKYFIHWEDKKVFGKSYTDLIRGLPDLLKLNGFFIELSSTDNYAEKDVTVNLLSRLLRKGETDNNIYAQLANKIRLDGNTINGDLFLDTVTVNLVNDLNVSQQIDFKLKDLLPRINEGSKNVSRLLDRLTSLGEMEKDILRSKVFVLKPYNPSLIESTILNQKEELTYEQFLYLLIPYWFNKNTGTNRLKLAAPNPLTKAYADPNNRDIGRVLDFMFKNRVTNKDYQIEHEGVPYRLIPKGAIICDDEELVFESESIKGYLGNWMLDDQEKRKFLIDKGALDEKYSHILYRKAVREQDVDTLEKLSGDLHSSNEHFINTARFFESRQSITNCDFSWCEKQIIDFYSEFAEIKNIDFDRRQFPLYTKNNERILRLHLLDKNKRYYKVLRSWGIYNNEVTNQIFTAGDFLIPNGLKLPQGYNAIVAEITEEVDKAQLMNSSARYTAGFYEEWNKYEEHVINIYEGDFIPYKVIFEGEVIADSIRNDERVWEDDKEYYVCLGIRSEIPFCLKSMNVRDAMSLAQAKFLPQTSKQNSRNNDDLTEDEIRELERLFNRKLSSIELSSHWLLACFKALKYYKQLGYDVSYAERNFESSIKKRMLERLKKGSREICVLPRSAKQNLLRITLAAWNVLNQSSTELFVLNSNGHQIFSDHGDLMDSADNLLFTIVTADKDSKTKIVSNLFERESIHDSQYDDTVQVILLIQLKGGSMFSSLFSSFNNETKISEF